MHRQPSPYSSTANLTEADVTGPAGAIAALVDEAQAFDGTCPAHLLHELNIMKDALDEIAQCVIY